MCHRFLVLSSEDDILTLTSQMRSLRPGGLVNHCVASQGHLTATVAFPLRRRRRAAGHRPLCLPDSSPAGAPGRLGHWGSQGGRREWRWGRQEERTVGVEWGRHWQTEMKVTLKKGRREEKQKLKQVTKKTRVSRGSGQGVRRRQRNPPQPGVSSLLRDAGAEGGTVDQLSQATAVTFSPSHLGPEAAQTLR